MDSQQTLLDTRARVRRAVACALGILALIVVPGFDIPAATAELSAAQLQAAAIAVPSKADWLADLNQLATDMPLIHRNLFHDMTPAEFQRQVAALRKEIPTATTAAIIAGFARLGSSIHDAHSGIASSWPELAFESVPVVFYVYDDGLFVQAADSAHAWMVGDRVLRLGRVSADSAIQMTASVTDASNPMTVRAFINFRLARPALLAAIGVNDRPDHLALTVEHQGSRRPVDLPTMGRDARGIARPGGTGYWPGPRSGLGWIDGRSASHTPDPLWLQHPGSAFWSAYDSTTHTLYAQCNQIGNTDSVSLREFFHRIVRWADSASVERLVVDLRQNGGGDNTLLAPIVDDFVRSRIANERGRLFIITGRMTQSAAQNFVNQLELHTQAIFVGEPTGERPNMYGDPVRYVMPRTGLRIALATLWWQDMGPLDERIWTGPYIAAPPNSADYAANRDPALTAILAWHVDQPLSARLALRIAAGDSAGIVREYSDFVHDPIHRWTDVSNSIYALADSESGIGTDSTPSAKFARTTAVELLTLNVVDHPQSARAHAELADALEASHQMIDARREGEVALRIDTHLADARLLLQRLGPPTARH